MCVERGGVASPGQHAHVLYQLFHGFDVHSFRSTKVKGSVKYLSSGLLFLDFATKEQAKAALAYNGTMLHGQRTRVSIAKLPLKYTVSWDSSRCGVHNSGRDLGSAVGTNFEEVRVHSINTHSTVLMLYADAGTSKRNSRALVSTCCIAKDAS